MKQDPLIANDVATVLMASGTRSPTRTGADQLCGGGAGADTLAPWRDAESSRGGVLMTKKTCQRSYRNGHLSAGCLRQRSGLLKRYYADASFAGVRYQILWSADAAEWAFMEPATTSGGDAHFAINPIGLADGRYRRLTRHYGRAVRRGGICPGPSATPGTTELIVPQTAL